MEHKQQLLDELEKLTSLLELAIEMNHRTNSIMDVLEYNQNMIVKMQDKISELETALLEFL